MESAFAARTVLAWIGLLAAAGAASAGLGVDSLRTEYLANPTGIDASSPRLSWQVASDQQGQKQTAYRILVASTAEKLAGDEGDLWDTGRVEGGETVNVPYQGRPLPSGQPCFWKAMAWDVAGEPSPWSQPASWSMGLLTESDWKAQWISYKDTSPLWTSREELYLPPPRYYRKSFAAASPIRRATVYASALGIYELHLNGKRVGDRRFTPGWSDYRRRAYYNAFDVTDLLDQGENTLGAIVADGWYSGYVGYGLLVGYGPNHVGRYFYGKTPALILQLEIEYADGSTSRIITDPTWKVATGPEREADIIMGETYDARREMPGWDTAAFDDSQWETAIAAEANGSTKATFFDRAGPREVELGFVKPPVMQAYPGPPIRQTGTIRPVSVKEQAPGVFIFDMGQNFSGVVRLKAKGPARTEVRLRFGEMLHPDGRLMTENLRRARATDAYILRGDPAGEVWTPRFTYHGFQFVEVSGYPGRPTLDDLAGVVIHSDTPPASSFTCSDPMINKFYQNVVWTQRSNFVEIPTDCPQRDERLGWSGDAQAYVRAATYNADVAAFFTKWMDDLVEAQRPNGAYPDYAPYPMQHGGGNAAFASAWTDVGVVIPWTIWKVYGDRRIIETHYESLQRFIEFRRKASPDFLGHPMGNNWGDWLSVGQQTPVDYVDTIYFAYSTRLMAEMAAAIGRDADAAEYRELFDKIKAAFHGKYVARPGRLVDEVDTQSAYAMALWVGLFNDAERQAAADRLARMILDNDAAMTTGFLGTRPLLPVLTATGHNDLAARLLQSRRYPSWGYEVANGATTVWERWNSYTKDDGFMNPSMNSFSHYAFGAVCEWMFQSLAGIDTDGPGFRKILIRPNPPVPGSNPEHPAIDRVEATYRSIHGPIDVAWKIADGRFTLDVTIPANTTARVTMPSNIQAGVAELGEAAADGVVARGDEQGRATFDITAGRYRFTCLAPTAKQ